jgi:hypothetical protein
MGDKEVIELARNNPKEVYDCYLASKALGISIRSIQRTLEKLHKRNDHNLNIILLNKTGYIFYWKDANAKGKTTRN